MKQYITIKQLNELTEKGKNKLLSYLFPGDYWGNIKERLSDIPKILSIGRMIEFLKKHGWFHIETQHDPVFYWDVVIDHKGYGGAMHEDLCDALWETIKQILEK